MKIGTKPGITPEEEVEAAALAHMDFSELAQAGDPKGLARAIILAGILVGSTDRHPNVGAWYRRMFDAAVEAKREAMRNVLN